MVFPKFVAKYYGIGLNYFGNLLLLTDFIFTCIPYQLQIGFCCTDTCMDYFDQEQTLLKLNAHAEFLKMSIFLFKNNYFSFLLLRYFSQILLSSVVVLLHLTGRYEKLAAL